MRTTLMDKHKASSMYERAKTLGRAGGPPLALPHHLERRRSYRVEVPAHAMLWHRGQFAGRYVLRDLSIGGCQLSDGPPREPGDHVELLLRIPHRGALSLSGEVTRRVSLELDRTSVGIRFARRTPTAEDWIHDVVLWALEGARMDCPRTSLVVVDDPQQAARIVTQLRQMGRPAVTARTPLDAVQLMVEQADRIDVVLIEEQLGGGHGQELADFLRHNHPGIHRVLLGPRAGSPALSEAHDCGTAEGILSLTPTARELERMLLRLGCWMPLSPGDAATC